MTVKLDNYRHWKLEPNMVATLQRFRFLRHLRINQHYKELAIKILKSAQVSSLRSLDLDRIPKGLVLEKTAPQLRSLTLRKRANSSDTAPPVTKLQCLRHGLWGKGRAAMPELVLALAQRVGVVGATVQDSNSIMHTLNSLASLVIPLPSKSSEAVEALCVGLTEGATFGGVGVGTKAYAAFCVLSNLFHGFASVQSALHFRIYTAMLEMAGRGGFMAELPTELAQVKEWFEAWGLEVGDRRKCLRLIHAGLAAQGSPEAATVMAELLSTNSDKDAKEAASDAHNCVLAAVKDPKNFLYDHLLLLKPVQALASTDPPLFRLLNILVSGSLKDYQAFLGKEKGIVGTLKLDKAGMVHKMRILTLMSMAESRTEMGLAELAETLSMGPDEELEEFVIQASLSQAVRGRMDQVGQRLLILGAESRRFERQEWELLRDKLAQWAANLAQVDATIAQALVPA